MTARHWIAIACTAVGLSIDGCASWHAKPALPSRSHMALEQLDIVSDTPLPQHHRLLEELRAQRQMLSTKLGLPLSEESIHVYLFASGEKLAAYMQVHFPGLPARRAFFVESDTKLNVYAYWGDRVAEDLRHEVAHGYLHSVVPNLPLWLDEGLAEYFEVSRGLDGVNRPHVDQLTADPQRPWQPDLERLEQLRDTEEMTQAEYAQSWAWTHFMLESSPQRLLILQGYLQTLARRQTPEPLSIQLRRADAHYQQNVAQHVNVLHQSLR
jgi:hypothetical protein